MSGSYYLPNYTAIAAATPYTFNQVLAQEAWNSIFSSNGFTSNAASDVGQFRTAVTQQLINYVGLAGMASAISNPSQSPTLPFQLPTGPGQVTGAAASASLQTIVTNLRTQFTIT